MSRRKLVASTLSIAALAALVSFAPARSRQAAPPAAPQSGGPAPTPTWLVSFDPGPKWDAAKSTQEQVGFADHVAVVSKLAADGTLLLGGPLLESFETHKLTGAIWIVKAENLGEVRKLLASDPWTKGELLRIGSVRAFFPAGGAWLPKPATAPTPGAK